jgi:hypothetical protein
MTGPPTHPSPSSGEPENLLVRVERLRQQAEDFQRSIEDEVSTFGRSSKRNASVRPRGGGHEDERNNATARLRPPR